MNISGGECTDWVFYGLRVGIVWNLGWALATKTDHDLYTNPYDKHV